MLAGSSETPFGTDGGRRGPVGGGRCCRSRSGEVVVGAAGPAPWPGSEATWRRRRRA